MTKAGRPKKALTLTVLDQGQIGAAEVLDANGVAALLRVSRATIYRLVATENLPCHPLGSDKRFLRAEILEWLAKR